MDSFQTKAPSRSRTPALGRTAYHGITMWVVKVNRRKYVAATYLLSELGFEDKAVRSTRDTLIRAGVPARCICALNTLGVYSVMASTRIFLPIGHARALVDRHRTPGRGASPRPDWYRNLGTGHRTSSSSITRPTPTGEMLRYLDGPLTQPELPDIADSASSVERDSSTGARIERLERTVRTTSLELESVRNALESERTAYRTALAERDASSAGLRNAVERQRELIDQLQGAASHYMKEYRKVANQMATVVDFSENITSEVKSKAASWMRADGAPEGALGEYIHEVYRTLFDELNRQTGQDIEALWTKAQALGFRGSKLAYAIVRGHKALLERIAAGLPMHGSPIPVRHPDQEAMQADRAL